MDRITAQSVFTLIRFVLIVCFILAFSKSVSAISGFIQTSDSVLDTNYRLKAIPLPVLFYSPETRFGFGAATTLSFKTQRNKELRMSQVNVVGVYTLENQLLAYSSFDLWLKNNAIVLDGEIGYYRFFYYFWGIGREPRQKELFGLNFPRLRFQGYHRIYKGLYLGLKYTFDAVNITQTEEAGRLAQSEYYTGVAGGRISGGGLAIKYDTRNDNFYPTKGWNVYANMEFFSNVIGSEFNFQTVWMNAKYYWGLGNDRVIALNAYSRFGIGDVPFFHLSMVGGSHRMRGYYEGFHRDRHMIGWQAEYRMLLYKRIGIAAFAGNAMIANELKTFKIKHLLTTAGFGFRYRIDKQRKLNVRTDFGLSKETNGSYVLIGEGF
jgi:outer membrane protein assembly factor BamA